MEIFHQSFQYTPSNLPDFIECRFLLQSMKHFLQTNVYKWYMHCIMQNLKNAQVCIYSLADLNIGHCVELDFLEGKLG